MAKTKKTLEELNKKYGITGNTKYAFNGKNAPTSTTTKTTVKKNSNNKPSSTESEKREQNKSSASTLDDLNKKYGVTGKIKPKYTFNGKNAPATSTTKKYTDYNAETKNAYTSAKDRVTSKTTIKSNMSDDERKKRIKSINSELTTLKTKLSGYSRASAYGTSKAMSEAKKKDEARIAELTQELKSLERVGTFSASELKQFEIDDANEKVSSARQKVNSFGARPSLESAEAYKQAVSEQYKAGQEVNRLESEQAEYKRLERLEELNAHTKKVTANKDFAQNSKYSPTKPKTDEELKAEGYKQATSGEWYKENFFGYADFYEGEDSDLYTYINDESKRQTIGANNITQTAQASTAFGAGVPSSGTDTYRELGYHVLTEEEKGAFNYLYHQDRINGTKTAEEYLEKISPLLQERAMTMEALYYKELSKESPVVMSAISLGTNLQNAAMFPAKATATALGVYDEAPILDMYGNRTQAIRGAVSEDMGIVGKLGYNAVMSIGDMGVAMAFGGGNGKMIQAIMSSSAGSSTISEAKKNGASDGKALVLGLGSAAIEWATEKYSVEAILSDPKSIRGFIAKNILTEGTEEGASNIANTALDAIVSEVFGEQNELEQRISYLVAYEGKTEEEALVMAFNEKLQSLGEDVLVGGLTGFGMSGAKASAIGAENAIRNGQYVSSFMKDGEMLDALVEKGKSYGEGSKPFNLATEIEQAKENGDVKRGQIKSLIKANDKAEASTTPDPLEQAAREVVEERNRNTPLYEKVEAQSRSNEPVTVEDVKKVTGFGDRGAELVAKTVNTDGATFYQTVAEVKPSYLAGFNNPDMDIKKVAHTFDSQAQQDAYTVGQQDAVIQNAVAKENAKSATIYDGVFTENEYTKNWSEATKKMVSTVAKHFGMDISAVDKIIASRTIENGVLTEHEANASHYDGKMEISNNKTAEKLIHALVMHESGHRMEQFATDEWNELSSFLYERAERLGRRVELGVSQGMLFDDVKAQHDEAGISLSTKGYIGEIAVRELETIFSSPEEFNNFVSEIESNQQVKSAWGKFVQWLSELIEDLKRAWSQRKMTAEEKAEARKALAELERIKELYAKAYLATKDAVAERAKEQSTDTNSTKNLEIKINEEYNGNENYSLKSKYNEYNTIGMQWAYSSSTKIGDKKVLYNPYKKTYVLAEATKDDLGFIEVKSGTYKQMREDEKFYESNKQGEFSDDERAIDTAIHNFEVRQNDNTWDNVDVANRGTGIQNAEVSKGKSKSNRTADTQTTDGDLNKKDYSLKQKAPTFYSYMGKTIDEMKQDKIGANSVVSYLTGRGVKAEEIKWSGIETFLEGKKSVSKAELQEFVAGSMLQIETKTLSGDGLIEYTEDESKSLSELSEVINEYWEKIDNLWMDKYGEEIPWDIRFNDNAEDSLRLEMRKLQRTDTESDDFFRQIYNILGNIRTFKHNEDAIIRRATERTNLEKGNSKTKYGDYALDGGSNYRELLFKLPNSEYTNDSMSYHWGEEGILAHARIQDFDVDGQKMLFIEEIQSDWHNEGAKKGYADESLKLREQYETQQKQNKAERESLIKQLSEHYEGKVAYPESEAERTLMFATNDSYMNSLIEKYAIPAELAKRAKAYDVAQKEVAKLFQKSLKKGVEDAPFRNNYHEYVLKNLIRMAAEEGYDTIGWTTADIQSQRWSDEYAEGYRIEYDQDIPKFLNKYGKKWGAKVGKTEIGKVEGHWEDKARWVEEEGNEVWSMPITDSMKESVLYEGQPMFSLKKLVEETKNLIAVHNMQSSELERTLDLGGLPMPSIAIIKAQSGHSEYGDVSLVFDKSVIDPKANKNNKVYGGDAWTPVYPKIEYKPNDKLAKKISDKYYELSRKFGYDESKPLYSYVYDLEEQLNRNKGEAGMINELHEDTRVMQLYLLDSGKDKVETVNKEIRTELTDAEVEMNEFFIKELGADVVDEVMWDGNGTPMAHKKNYMSKYGDSISAAYKKLLSEVYHFTEEEIQNTLDSTKSFEYLRFVRDAHNYRQNGRVTIKTETDYEATQKAIKDAAGEDYRKWVDSLFKGIEEKSGIRNNADYFTNSGNRRSWEALHWENNLENVVKVMKSQADVGSVGFFSGQNIWGVAAKDYRSIEEIKADSDRLQQIPEEEYNKIKEGFGQRLSEIAHSIMDKSERNPFIASDNAMECIVDAVRNSKTKSGILNNLKQYRQLTVTQTTVDDIVALVSDIANMPTEYFEAKPKRAVELNEIATAIIPDNTSQTTKTRLDDMGIKYLEYESGNEQARLEALNSLEDVKFSLKGNNTTSTKDRAELLDIIEHLKGEFEVTKFAKADPKKLEKMTRSILKEYSSKADFDETYKAIDELYQYMANGEEGHTAVWEDVYRRACNVARTIVENSLMTDDTMYQQYTHLREYLRTTPMKFTEYDSVPTFYENFNELRKRNMGRLKFTNDGMSIDSVYQELSHLYPEFFDSEEQTNSADQLERIIDVLDELQPMAINPFDRQIEQVAMQLANDLTSRFFDVPQAKPTFADKAERRVVEARIKGGKKVEAVRQQKDAKIKKLIESQREKTKKQLDKLREQRDAKVEKEKAKRRDAISKMSETQKAKVLRARIMRHASDLSKKLVNPTDNQHIPYELQGAVATLLEHINLESNYTYDTESHSYKKNDEGLPTKRTQAFHDLQKVYADIATSVVVDPDLLGEHGLLSDVISLGDKRIADMTSSELFTVWQTIRAIEASVSTANKVFSEGKFATILEVAEALRAYNEGKAIKTELKGIIGKGKKLVTLDMLTPETYLHYLGNAGDSIFRMMRDAQDKHIRIMKEVVDFTHKELKDVNVNSLEKTMHTVKLGGENVQLSTAQLMELYVLMKREQAKEHILVGGILPDVTKGKGLKLNTKADPIINISATEIGEALSVLTEEQKKIADNLQKYVSSVLSAYGNEASMQVYNYEKFTEENYWTIRTNKNEIKSDVEGATVVTSVANKGMTKATKPHANTSVRIGSIFDTFASHSSDMATYAAWLGTSEDVNRIRNFVFWEDGVRTGTVKGILDAVHGTQGSNYLEKLLTDIAIGVKGTDNLNPFDKLVGHYKAASIGANLRVIIQQPTAIIRAMDMIDAHYLVEGAVRPFNGWKKATKYAPIAQWKSWGYFDINTGRQMKDVLFDNASLLEKTKRVGMWGASTADSFAWGQLWNAVEAETKAKHKELEVGSEAYYKTVAKRFTEIVDHTQVVDGILQRSHLMRSADNLTKMATSFMGEPTKQYNMAISAFNDVKTGKGDARKKAVSRLGRTAVSLAVAGIVNACAQSIIDAMRDDDKEEKYWERWVTAFIGDGDETKWYDTNLADTANPLNYVPFAKDIVSILRGYDVKRMDTEAITKVFDASKNMYKASTGTGKYTVAEATAQLFAEIARMYGVPVANVKRDVKSLVMATAIETDNYLMQYRMEKAMLDINYAGNSKNYMDILFNAYNNDREAYEIIYNDMLDSGYDADKIQSGMETRMKKAEGVEKSSELSKRYMSPDDEERYDSSLSRVKSSKVWKSATSTQRKNAEADLYNYLTSTTEDMEKLRAEARTFGVDETEYTLWQLAIEMADQPKGQEGSGSYSAKEKAEAINSLNLDDREIAYFFGKGLTESGKEELNEVLNEGIDVQEYVNFKAATSDMKADKNANGKSIPNSKKRKVVNYLNNANLTSDEWDYFYYEIMNYKK